MSLVIQMLPLCPNKNVTKGVQLWRRCVLLRAYTTRKECADYLGPRCAKENLEETCPAKVRRLEAGAKLPGENSMWENPECCVDPCPDYLPRFDELYYKSSDKLARKYQQTWIGCPPIQIKPKKLCCFENLEYPPIEKRPRKGIPKTACAAGGSAPCLDLQNKGCTRIKLAGCQGVRLPPKCKTERGPAKCQKDCTPYPSFSECVRDRPETLHPQECKCLDHPMMCEVWAEMRKRMAFMKN